MAGNSLGAYLKTLRKNNGYSQEFVASNLNIIRQTYSHYETGRIIPPADALYHLAIFYQIPIDTLMELAMQDNDKEDEKCFVSLHCASAPPPKLAPMTSEEEELLCCYKQLDTRDKEDILDFIKLKIRNRKKGMSR